MFCVNRPCSATQIGVITDYILHNIPSVQLTFGLHFKASTLLNLLNLIRHHSFNSFLMIKETPVLHVESIPESNPNGKAACRACDPPCELHLLLICLQWCGHPLCPESCCSNSSWSSHLHSSDSHSSFPPFLH